jgi:spore germination protein KB
MVMGSDFTALHTFSSYTLAKQIKLGNYIERIEAVLAITWVITLFFKVCFYYFASSLALAQIFELKDYHPIVLPLSMICITLSFVIYPNIVYERNWDNTTWISYVLTVGFFLPILLLAVGFFRGVTGSNKCKEKGST